MAATAITELDQLALEVSSRLFPPSTNDLSSALGPVRKLHLFTTCHRINYPSVFLEQAALERQHERLIFGSTDDVGPGKLKRDANLGSVS